MKKFIFLGILALVLLIQIANASEVVSCTVSPQEINLSVSSQVAVMVKINNTQNATFNDTVEISFPTTYLSCVGECTRQTVMPTYSSSSVSFTLHASNATTAEQAIMVTKPASYACPSILKIIAAIDTTPPTVGSVSPISVNAGQSTTFTASVSDNVGVMGCNFSFGNAAYSAAVSGNAASYTLSALEGNYSVYFKCWDAAGNIGTGTAVTVTASKSKLSVSISLPKTSYYPTDNFEPRITITDASGKFVVDASIKNNITGPKTYQPYFYYSALCDCYKGNQWFDEGTLIGNYILYIEASHPSYQSSTVTARFSVTKPTLQMALSTDKNEYNPGDSIKITAQIKDGLGNPIVDGSVKGEIKDADTGSLITTIYPQTKNNIYYYEYYVGSEGLGKSYTVFMSVKWKEQSASESKTVLITKRELNGEIDLEKDVLMLGDSLQGKVKVFDKDGSIIRDAKVNVEIKGSSYEKPGAVGKAEPTMIRGLSSTYKDGLYEIEKWKIDDWFIAGNYTLSVRIDIGTENIVLEKKIEITKEKLNIQVFLDQTSYAPGDRIYVKILVTYANGSVVPNAYVSGEIFPLIQEIINQTAGITGAVTLVSPGARIVGEPTAFCRVYILSPQGPLYYKGEYIQKTYIDDVYIPHDCPAGKYALRAKVGVSGYAETEVTKEFDVNLHKLLLETGIKINSRPDTVDVAMYAEVKDDQGEVIPYANIRGYLHPSETTEKEKIEECTKNIYFEYNEFTKRYISKVFLGKYECPAGKYLIEITASQPSYEAADVKQTVEINYSESFEYNIVVPPVIGAPVCKEVSCGSNCVNRICEAPIPQGECYAEVSDKDCVRNCVDRAATTEKEAATSKEKAAAKPTITKEATVEVGVPDCVKNCVKKVPCRGSGVTQPESRDMLAKLDAVQAEIKETHAEVIETRKQVDTLAQWIKSIIDFINSLVASFGGGQISPIKT